MAGSQQPEDEIFSGINVTPLVDITLVLMIIFIVTAKIIVEQQSLPMDLPKAASGQDVQTVFSVQLAENGDVQVDDKRLTNDEGILPLAREARSKNPELRAVIKADAKVPHGRVIRVMDLLKQGGVSKIAFGVTPIAAEPGAAPAASK